MVAMAGVQGAKAGVVATQQASEAGEDAGRYPAGHPASLMHTYGENTFGGLGGGGNTGPSWAEVNANYTNPGGAKVGEKTASGAIIADYFTAEERNIMNNYGRTGEYSGTLYRGDGRSATEINDIINHGMVARGNNKNMYAYRIGTPDTHFISFSKNIERASMYAQSSSILSDAGDIRIGHIIEVNHLNFAVDIRNARNASFFEQEVRAIGSVAQTDIVAIYRNTYNLDYDLLSSNKIWP
ncbi:hypothetical protein [Cedecea sp. NFIX57]|uniref:hypothetical protein n=1 Tax=Cedecea sp. NFIX57 TaxID=1566286 RepID=UPI000A0BC661|nr:hypothetical protein [Cedecea sp. NFIX57]SMG61899.1 hypothetical protein SAMN03159353_10729 [Cedecea sp. NFIX57]